VAHREPSRLVISADGPGCRPDILKAYRREPFIYRKRRIDDSREALMAASSRGFSPERMLERNRRQGFALPQTGPFRITAPWSDRLRAPRAFDSAGENLGTGYTLASREPSSGEPNGSGYARSRWTGYSSGPIPRTHSFCAGVRRLSP